MTRTQGNVVIALLAVLVLVPIASALWPRGDWEYRVHAQPHDLSRNFLKKEGAELDEPPSLRDNPARFRAYEATEDRSQCGKSAVGQFSPEIV